MSKIYYYGTDGKVYGPVTETDVQAWYVSGYFSSEMRFQISGSDRFDPNGQVFTLGELIEKNGRLLPFYFSPEKAIRERAQEETLKKLKQDVEALRVNKEKSKDKETIEILQRKLASLEESQNDLLKRVKEQSSKKEGSPASPELEKRVVELRKKVEDQEKNAVSMKKIISDVTSKCDRNDTKMEQSLKKWKEIDEKMSESSVLISQLQENDKTICDALNTCKEVISNNAHELLSVMSELTEVKKNAASQMEESSMRSSELQTIQKELEGVIATLNGQKDRLTALEKRDEYLSAEEYLSEDAETYKDSNGISQTKSAAVAPWELEMKNAEINAETEPWNQPNASSKKEATEQAKKAETAVKPVKATVETAPKPAAKNWDAICRELSDDDEDEEFVLAPEPVAAPATNSLLQSILDARPSVPRQNRELIERFLKMFRLYLHALRTKEMDQLHLLGIKAIEGINFSMLEWRSDSPEFIPLAQAMLAEIPKVCDEMELLCWSCPCRMFTPLNVFDHLVDQGHFEKMQELGDIAHLIGMAVQRVMGKLSCLLKRTAPFKREEVINTIGLAMYRPLEGNECLRPTRDFVRSKFQEYRNVICKGDERAMMLANVGGPLNHANDEYYMRVIRKWFKVEKNREKFCKELDEHLSTGIPHCSECKFAFNSNAEFYRHVTSYWHARMDQRMFAGCFFRLARGTQDWDITM